MTELYIDGQRAVLPRSLDLKIRRQNPVLTKNGTFTLDLALPLAERNNSILYRHIERLQSASPIEGRRATLIADGHVILDGTEAFISNTPDEVRIQLLSGNSELNYLIGSDRFISSLDLGEEDLSSDAAMDRAIRGEFPDFDFTCPAVRIGKVTYNHQRKVIDRSEGAGTMTVGFTNRAIQPYLLAMLRKVLRALGYTIRRDEAAGDPFICRIFILNPDRSGRYNRALRGWTVKDFIEEVEKLLNLSVVVDDSDRSVSILLPGSEAGAGTYVFDNVLEDFERVAADGEERVSYRNVRYDFPSANEYKYMDVEPEAMDAANIIEVDSAAEALAALSPDGGRHLSEELFDKRLDTTDVWRVRSTGDLYIPFKKLDTRAEGDEPTFWRHFLRIDAFHRQAEDPHADFLKLALFPCAFSWSVTARRPGGYGEREERLYREPIPYQPGSDDGDEDKADEETPSIRELIENGVPDFDKNRRQVALCAIDALHDGHGSYRVYTDPVRPFLAEPDDATPKGSGSFRLDTGGLGWLHRPNRDIDTTREYTIRFMTRVIPDIRARFLFHNKLFVCKELEYRVTAEGIHPVLTGVFYPVK